MFGYEDGDKRHGRKTAGEVLAANVEKLDRADWHKVVVGVSRYHILKEAMATLKNPMRVESSGGTTPGLEYI